MNPRRPTSQPSSRGPQSAKTPFVYPHHVRDLQGALGASIGRGYDVLQKQLWKLRTDNKPPRT